MNQQPEKEVGLRKMVENFAIISDSYPRHRRFTLNHLELWLEGRAEYSTAQLASVLTELIREGKLALYIDRISRYKSRVVFGRPGAA